MFKDRTDAGVQLGRALAGYIGRDVLVLAVPRGGVEVGSQVARHLNADFSILVSRKLPFVDNPEAGFGAIAEDGSRYICPYSTARLGWPTIERIIAEQKAELDRRVKVLRGGKALGDIEGRTVILVDDGIAVGSTIRVSIMLCKKRRARRIVVAVPVAGFDTAKEIAKLVDEIVVLECPDPFYAVAQVYENWYDVDDREVIEILSQWKQQAHRQ